MEVLKFKQYNNVNETTYSVGEDGIMRIKEYEMVKDFHPNKFVHLNKNYYESEFVWVIRKNEKIISVMSGDISEELIIEFFKSLENHGKN